MIKCNVGRCHYNTDGRCRLYRENTNGRGTVNGWDEFCYSYMVPGKLSKEMRKGTDPDDGKCNSPSFEDGFVTDCRMEIDGILNRNGIDEGYWRTMP